MTTELSTHPQHRHLAAHRLGQDDADRAHPVLHRAGSTRIHEVQRQGRRRRQDGLDGSRAREGHHDPVRRDLLRLEGLASSSSRPQHQHHRHARPRRLHDRGRARAARARRRDPGALRSGKGVQSPVDHRRPPDEALPRPAHRVRQQDGPRRARTTMRVAEHAQGEARPPPGAAAGADGRRGQVRGHHRPRSRCKAYFFDGDDGEKIRIEEIRRPTYADEAKKPRARRSSTRVADVDDELAEKFLDGGARLDRGAPTPPSAARRWRSR